MTTTSRKSIFSNTRGIFQKLKEGKNPLIVMAVYLLLTSIWVYFDTQNRGGESLDTGKEAHVRVDAGKFERIQQTGCPSQCPTDQEGDRNHPVDVDAHQAG